MINKYDIFVNESVSGWYHGTPDSREIKKSGGFTDNTIFTSYVKDPIKLTELQDKMKLARESGDMKSYHNYMGMVDDFKGIFKHNKPIFLTNKYSVAKTYADPQRAFDYQNCEPRVYSVNVKCSKTVTIYAPNERFRFIGIENVKDGFISSGVSEEEIEKLISMFNYNVNNSKGIKTDVIGAIGCWLGFSCIDVVGVLDSYHGGKVKSTVKMVFEPSSVTI